MSVNSMTGYGKAQATVNGKIINVEIKSVNHRYFDLNCHNAKVFSFLEDTIKKKVGEHISRGKIDLFLYVEFVESDGSKVSINRPLLNSYMDAFRLLNEEYGLKSISSVMDVMRIPDVVSVQSAEQDEETLSNEILPIVEQALVMYDHMRSVEGKRLADDCLEKLSLIEAEIERIATLIPQSIENYKNRLETKIKEVLADRQMDEARVLTEVAIFSDKIAVDEEMVRLKSHIAQFKSLLQTPDKAVGKKLDFLVQEMNREINTTGSKCNHIDITAAVLNMKNELEKIREQIQNIE